MADKKRGSAETREEHLSDRLKELTKLLDRFNEADLSKDTTRGFGIKAPYSDARAPKPSHWAK